MAGIGQISIHPDDLGQILAAAFRTHIGSTDIW